MEVMFLDVQCRPLVGVTSQSSGIILGKIPLILSLTGATSALEFY